MSRNSLKVPCGATWALLALALILSCAVAARAQTPSHAPRAQAAAPVVTVTATSNGVRFAALGPVKQSRLEVFDAAGNPLSDTGFLPGNLRDFTARDPRGETLADGLYQCVFTTRDLAGRLSLKQAAVIIQNGQAALSLGESEPSGAVASAAQVEENGAATLTTHDGRDGAVTSTAGALTLRTGDVLAGKDAERVRVTADGRVGIGTDKPEATLDVAGAVRVSEGFKFADGTTLDASGGKLTVRNAEGDPLPGPSAAGSGSVNRLAKWAETGGQGTLTDSALYESGGFLGVNTSTPEGTFHMQSPDTTVFKVVSSGSVNTGRAVFQMYRGLSAQASGWDFGYNVDLASENFITRELTNGAPTTRLTLQKGTGNFGIGASNPQARLDVNGVGRFTPGGSGGTIQFGTPNTETGMIISNTTTRADLRFDGSTFKLLAGPAGGPPSITSGVSVNTAGNVGIGMASAPTAKLHVLTSGQPGIYSESTNRGVYGVSTGSSYGVYGESVNGIGTQGESTINIGVSGLSISHYGVFGASTSSVGVRGQTASGSAASPGVQGVSTGAGGVGVRGDGTTGVYGTSISGTGVTGESTSGTGVYASSVSGQAVYASGNAGQARDKGGFVKAMLYVNPFLPASQYIVRCYNGQTNSSTGNCGFTVTRNNVGDYTINFGFPVNDRFFSLSIGIGRDLSTTVGPRSGNANEASVGISYAPDLTSQDATFYVLVY